MLPILLLWVPPFYTTVRVNAAQILAVGVGVMLPILLLLVTPFYTTVRVNAARILAVGVGVMLPILLLLVRLLHYGEGQCCPFFCRWRFPAGFSADADVYAAERRELGPFVSLLWDEKVTTRSRNTAAIIPARPGP